MPRIVDVRSERTGERLIQDQRRVREIGLGNQAVPEAFEEECSPSAGPSSTRPQQPSTSRSGGEDGQLEQEGQEMKGLIKLATEVIKDYCRKKQKVSLQIGNEVHMDFRGHYLGLLRDIFRGAEMRLTGDEDEATLGIRKARLVWVKEKKAWTLKIIPAGKIAYGGRVPKQVRVRWPSSSMVVLLAGQGMENELPSPDEDQAEEEEPASKRSKEVEFLSDVEGSFSASEGDLD